MVPLEHATREGSDEPANPQSLSRCITAHIHILEDLKVLRRSPDLLNNVKIGQGQLQHIMEQILFLPCTFWSSDINNLMNKPSNSPVISEKKMFR